MSEELLTQHPYPGLRPFERHETDIFFGREKQTDELLDLLGEQHFLAVIGTSGCGKSSLVRTGLMAGLEAGLLAKAGANWRMADMRPGNDPYAALVAALLKPEALKEAWAAPFDDLEQAGAFLLATLRRGPKGLAEVLQQSALGKGQRLLLLVDQFEELFRYQQGQQKSAGQFVALLLAASQHPDIYVCVTMRSDFLGECAQFRGLAEAINQGLYLTPRLEREPLYEAIAYPAKVFGGEIDTAVVNRLVNSVGADPDQLPILQDALMQMWKLASGKNSAAPRITLAELEAVGGLKEALSQHADSLYERLDKKQQKVAETLFRCLTEREGEGRNTRRPTKVAEIAKVAGVEWTAVVAVVAPFRAEGHHLLTPAVGQELNENTTLDISHESLTRQWRRLQQWVEDEAETSEHYRRLSDSAERWHSKQGSLLQDLDLKNALIWQHDFQPTQQWSERYGGNLETVLTYLGKSHQAEERKKKIEEAERQRKLRRAGRIALFSFFALIITAALGGWAWFERQNAQTAASQAEQAEQQRTTSLFNSQLTHGSLLTRVEDYAEARRVLAESRTLDQDIAAPRRHARNLLAGYVEIIGGTADKVYRGAGAALSGGVAVSPDGRLLAAAGERGTLVLFDAQSGELLQRLEGHDPKAGQVGTVMSVIFDLQGRWMFSGGDDRRIIRWSLSESGRAKKEAVWRSDSKVKALAITPDGQTLASGDADGVITLWQVDSAAEAGEPLGVLQGHTDAIASPNGLAFSKDGGRLASASFDDTAMIWDTQTRQKLITLNGHNNNVEAIAFSPDGKWVATASKDKQLILWESETGRALRLFRGHDNIVFAVAFSANGKHLFSASRDNTLRLWDVESGVTERVYQGHQAGLLSVVSYQQHLYTAAADGTVRRWSLPAFVRDEVVSDSKSVDAQPLLISQSQQWHWDLKDTPISTAISPKGGLVAVGFGDGSLRLYSLASSNLPSPSGRGVGGEGVLWERESVHNDQILRIAFNSDATLVATSSDDNKAKLWAIEHHEDGIQLRLLHTLIGHSDTVHAVVFSPDGQQLATAGYDGRVGLLQIDKDVLEVSEPTEQLLTFIEGAHKGAVANVAFSTNGNTLMSVGIDDFATRFWDLTTTPPSLKKELPKAEDELLWAALSPNGREVVAVGRDQVVKLHNLDAENTPPRSLVGHEQTVYRAIYSPDGQQLATVSSDMSVRLWDLEQGKQLFKIRLPTERKAGAVPLWDFDFRCLDDGYCWIAVPLTMGRLSLYRLPYERFPGE